MPVQSTITGIQILPESTPVRTTPYFAIVLLASHLLSYGSRQYLNSSHHETQKINTKLYLCYLLNFLWLVWHVTQVKEKNSVIFFFSLLVQIYYLESFFSQGYNILPSYVSLFQPSSNTRKIKLKTWIGNMSFVYCF